MVKRNSITIYIKASFGEMAVQGVVKDFLAFHYDQNTSRGERRFIDYSLSQYPVIMDKRPVYLGAEKKEAYVFTINVRSATQSTDLERDIGIFFYGSRIDFLADELELACG